MAVILNISAFTGCIIWFHKLIRQPGNKLILPVILVYLAATILSFALSFALQHDYLDGLLHMIVSAIAILVFWLWTSIVIVVKYAKKGHAKFLLIGLAQTSALLIVPVAIVFLISNASFKIGG
ncbi:MAG: hypothetical protein ACO1N0_05365 [Fluviicola sp.]